MALRPCALSEGPKHCKIHGFAPLRPFRRPQNLMKYMVLRTCAPTPEATTQDRKAGAIQNSSKLDGPGNLSSRRCRASAGLPPGFRRASATLPPKPAAALISKASVASKAIKLDRGSAATPRISGGCRTVTSHKAARLQKTPGTGPPRHGSTAAANDRILKMVTQHADKAPEA